MRKQPLFIIFLLVFGLLFPACSISKVATKFISNALTKEGSSEVFTSDSDPLLVGDALPFTIKMYESLLEANPNHQGLLRMTGSLFVMYANAFVQQPAEQFPRHMYAERLAELDRARRLYLRGVELLYRGLELKYPAFAKDQAAALAKMKKDDVTSLYWAAAGGILAYSIDPLDVGLGLRIFEFFTLINRAYELDPDYNSGVLDDFLLLYYASVPEILGGDRAKADFHFKRALEKSNGLLASPYVSYAKAVSIPAQDYDTFKEYLEAALAIDPDADPPNRLINTVNQQKARFLLDSAAQFFISVGFDDFWDNYDWDDEDWDDENR